MSQNTRDELEDPNLRAAYEQVCTGYRDIDDFRAKLLGLLPLASGAGIFLLLSDDVAGIKPSVPHEFLLPTGVFGFLVTLGLYLYELKGIQKCIHILGAGERIEGDLGVEGRFSKRPGPVAGFVDERAAAVVICSSVLAAWAFVAAVFSWPYVGASEPATWWRR